MRRTYRDFLRVPHNALRYRVHQRLEIHVQERLQANDVLLVRKEQGDKDAEQTAQHENEAIATFAPRTNNKLLDFCAAEFLAKLIFFRLAPKKPGRVDLAGRV